MVTTTWLTHLEPELSPLAGLESFSALGPSRWSYPPPSHCWHHQVTHWVPVAALIQTYSGSCISISPARLGSKPLAEVDSAHR